MQNIFNVNEQGVVVAGNVTRAEARSVRSLLINQVKEFAIPPKTEQEARAIISDGWTAKKEKVGAYSDVQGQKIYTALIGDLLDRATLSYHEGVLTIGRGGMGDDGRMANLSTLSQFITDATGFQKGTPEFDNSLSNTFRYMKQDFEGDLPTIFYNAVKIMPLLGNASIEVNTKLTSKNGVILVERSATAGNFNLFDNGQQIESSYHVSLEQKFKIPVHGLDKPPEQFEHENLLDAEQKERIWEESFNPRLPEEAALVQNSAAHIIDAPEENNEPFEIEIDESYLAKDQEQNFNEFLNDIRLEPATRRMVRTRRAPKPDGSGNS